MENCSIKNKKYNHRLMCAKFKEMLYGHITQNKYGNITRTRKKIMLT